jgi:biopolymer transport protein ExbB
MTLGKIVTEFSYYMDQGGFVMWPLVGATLVLWYAIGYRFSVLRTRDRASVRTRLEKGRSRKEGTPEGIVDAAVARGLEIAAGHPPRLRKLLDDAFSDFSDRIGRHAVLVRSIVIVAPLAGLLGTVTGMMETFRSLADSNLYSQTGGVAGGISEALITTQMGLAVAIPGMIVGRILDKRQRQIARELEQIKDILCSEEGKGTVA